MDDGGTRTKGWGRVQKHRISRGHLEVLNVNREQLTTKYRHRTETGDAQVGG